MQFASKKKKAALAELPNVGCEVLPPYVMRKGTCMQGIAVKLYAS
jgi:hypothetical protein